MKCVEFDEWDSWYSCRRWWQLQGDDTDSASVDSSLPACDPQASMGQNNTK